MDIPTLNEFIAKLLILVWEWLSMQALRSGWPEFMSAAAIHCVTWDESLRPVIYPSGEVWEAVRCMRLVGAQGEVRMGEIGEGISKWVVCKSSASMLKRNVYCVLALPLVSLSLVGGNFWEAHLQLKKKGAFQKLPLLFGREEGDVSECTFQLSPPKKTFS